ncbi:hypothetical protein IE53DRAFT_379493 [Violaceomyces palustris]|uniref:Uncharacterized protein n=1 Tax=Violaceomyces palustris TaxID=1673888 RepID=A0ACD0NY69_9BASI|nr:hypothetical protein IE53DRAFT_379493 [Violaceomyces palustris]
MFLRRSLLACATLAVGLSAASQSVKTPQNQYDDNSPKEITSSNPGPDASTKSTSTPSEARASSPEGGNSQSGSTSPSSSIAYKLHHKVSKDKQTGNVGGDISGTNSFSNGTLGAGCSVSWADNLINGGFTGGDSVTGAGGGFEWTPQSVSSTAGVAHQGLSFNVNITITFDNQIVLVLNGTQVDWQKCLEENGGSNNVTSQSPPEISSGGPSGPGISSGGPSSPSDTPSLPTPDTQEQPSSPGGGPSSADTPTGETTSGTVNSDGSGSSDTPQEQTHHHKHHKQQDTPDTASTQPMYDGNQSSPNPDDQPCDKNSTIVDLGSSDNSTVSTPDLDQEGEQGSSGQNIQTATTYNQDDNGEESQSQIQTQPEYGLESDQDSSSQSDPTSVDNVSEEPKDNCEEKEESSGVSRTSNYDDNDPSSSSNYDSNENFNNGDTKTIEEGDLQRRGFRKKFFRRYRA